MEERRTKMEKRGKMKSIEYVLLVVFVIVLLASAVFGLFLRMSLISLLLLFIDFPIAAMVAVFASLGIREEEEAKSS
jgi:flagellar basal body-associated protein FliL